jgi:hypothetical protein
VGVVAQRAVDDVLAEARAEIAAGRFPDVIELRARLAGDADALARLDSVMAVHRARARLAQQVSDTKVSDTRSPLRTRVFVSGDLTIRRGDGHVIEWNADPAVQAWELRIGDERRELQETRSDLPLTSRPVRVNVVGRSRTGKVVRRAVLSGLTRENWNDRWQRR